MGEAYPQVAAMWLQERNGGLTPQKATPKMQVAVWWRCAAGHEWEERTSNRTAMPKWKNGDVAACRECVGYRVSHTFPVCGHTARVRALAPFGQEATEPAGRPGRCSRRGPLGGARAGRRGDQRARRRTGTARSVHR
ncbi:zinc-ribbon domain-containing protein [Streptomyces decoyicus]|uniref:zinc-ribbon domain-containing protein n=1 Tax=Streptomyces decoyicus TaxID=249567 RepID=UPI003629BE8D